MAGAGPERDDEAVIRRVMDGDRAAFHTLYNRYRDKVFSTVYRIIGNREEAVDVTQDVFVKVYRKLPTFRFDSKFSTWLYRIAVNFSINKINEFDRHARAHQKIARDPGAIPFKPIPNDRVLAAVQRLNPKLRAVVVLRYVQALAYDEIADVLDISIGTVKSRLHLAHEALRNALRDTD